MYSKIIGKQNVFSHYSSTMSKALSLVTLLLFLVATSFAPYISSKLQAQALANTTEESGFSNNNFEEEIHHERVSALFIVPTLLKEIPFPRHQILEPQFIVRPAIKPPLA